MTTDPWLQPGWPAQGCLTLAVPRPASLDLVRSPGLPPPQAAIALFSAAAPAAWLAVKRGQRAFAIITVLQCLIASVQRGWRRLFSGWRPPRELRRGRWGGRRPFPALAGERRGVARAAEWGAAAGAVCRRFLRSRRLIGRRLMAAVIAVVLAVWRIVVFVYCWRRKCRWALVQLQFWTTKKLLECKLGLDPYGTRTKTWPFGQMRPTILLRHNFLAFAPRSLSSDGAL